MGFNTMDADQSDTNKISRKILVSPGYSIFGQQ